MAGRTLGSGGWGGARSGIGASQRRRSGALDGAGVPGPLLFHRRFVAGDQTTRTVLEDLNATLCEDGLPPKAISNAELILAEVLNNVVEHAYSGDPGLIELWVRDDGGGLACTIADQGVPFPDDVMPGSDLAAITPPDLLPEGGFGWHIIRSLAVELHHQRRDGRNLLALKVPLG